MSIRTRLLFMMMLELAIWGAYVPKLFPYMGMLGFAPWQQGLVGASFGIASVVGIFFSNQFADRNFAAERFLAGSQLIAGLAMLVVGHSTTFWPFFAAYFVFSLVYVPTLSVTNAIAFAHMRNPAADFGIVRMGGTLGWMLISWPFIFLLSKHADVHQVSWIFTVSGIVCFALAAYSLTLPHTPPQRGNKMDPLAWRETLRELRVPFILVLFLVALFDSVIHAGYFIVSDGFLTNRVGIAGNLSMVVLSIGQAAEIVTMIFLGRALARLGWKTTMALGIFGHVLRYAVFSLFPDHVALIVAVQVMQGLCYAFFFATVCIFVDEVFPKDVRTSAQGLFNLLLAGVGGVVASIVFPYLMSILKVERLGADGAMHAQVDYATLFLVPTAAALVIMVALLLFFHPPHKRPQTVIG